MKFGGTSVGSAEAVERVIAIVAKRPAEEVVVVASAMSGVTDLLQNGLTAAAAGEAARAEEVITALRDKHHTAADALLGEEKPVILETIDSILSDYERFCDSVAVLGELTPRALDYTMGLGERMSVRLIAGALRAAGITAQACDATQLIATDSRFQNAAPDLQTTRQQVNAVLCPLLEEGIVPVVTGFIGATPEGIPTTLGRGGSDYSAALIGACLDSDEVWIWTDVDGVMSSDPRVIPEARTLETLSHLEVSELAYFGAKVLHPRTIRPVIESAIPVRVKNTFNTGHPGTLILQEAPATTHGVKAVTAIRDMSLVTVTGMGMLGVPGIAARTFTAVARTGTNVLLISQASSEQNICFAVPESHSLAVMAELESEFAREIERRDIDRIEEDRSITIITAVGAQMRHRPGIAGKIFTATGEAGVNVIAIAQGASECSISLVVAADDADDALRSIHALTLA
jgi:aspartate kinase